MIINCKKKKKKKKKKVWKGTLLKSRARLQIKKKYTKKKQQVMFMSDTGKRSIPHAA